MSVNQPKLFLHFGSTLAVALAASVGVAETTESEGTTDDDSMDPRIEVVIVTAEKRQEDILKVPLTMSAFNDRMIKELGMTNSKDIEQLVPGLQFGNDNVRWGQGTAIRGIGSRNWGEVHSDMAVATYVDGVYSRSAISVAPNLFDVERLEVGRGPQGTLNGRNSIAGSVSYITKRPTDEWDVDVLAEFTDQFTQRYNIALGGPLSEYLSFRITGGYHEGDGAQKN
ncbi:MAG: TonB-dependent receptor plug domain-containing protein, partial [Pseudomonadales bacterium]|nr:TonB-dependent receptor plug domain-containing protein [Pseudomonadales bacterium]